MHRPILKLLMLAALILAADTPAHAQRVEPVALTTSRQTVVGAVRPDSSRHLPRSRLDNAARGAFLGTGIGIAAGLVAAIVVTNGSYPDHSEDVLAYIAFPATGVFLGMVAGTIVGAFTTS